MSTVGLKIAPDTNIAKCAKIIRKSMNISISEIKSRIADGDYIYCGNYTEDADIACIAALYKELSDNGIVCEIYEHDRKSSIGFINNLLEMYAEIDEQIMEENEEIED